MPEKKKLENKFKAQELSFPLPLGCNSATYVTAVFRIINDEYLSMPQGNGISFTINVGTPVINHLPAEISVLNSVFCFFLTSYKFF